MVVVRRGWLCVWLVVHVNCIHYNIDEEKLVEIVKEMAILDSDFYFDSIADLILNRIREMNFKEMQEYLGLDDDFSPAERELIDKHRLEYLISLNNVVTGLTFPFICPHFTTLKNKFYCPLNVVLSRIVKRSKEKPAFMLSMTNKTLKNENDRHPIKLAFFRGGEKWLIETRSPYIRSLLSPEHYDKIYFDAFKNRKIIVESRNSPANSPSLELWYDSSLNEPTSEGALLCSSLNFAVPDKNDVVRIYFMRNPNQIYTFDIKICPAASIVYEFTSIQLDFALVYQQLVAPDLLKQITISSSNAFPFSNNPILKIYKKANASKFHEVFILCFGSGMTPKFKEFILEYMEDDGIIRSSDKLFKIPKSYDRKKCEYFYQVSIIKDYL